MRSLIIVLISILFMLIALEALGILLCYHIVGPNMFNGFWSIVKYCA